MTNSTQATANVNTKGTEPTEAQVATYKKVARLKKQSLRPIESFTRSSLTKEIKRIIDLPFPSQAKGKKSVQTNTIQKENATMKTANLIKGLSFVSSKEMVNVDKSNKQSKIVLPVQVKMTLEVGTKKQEVTFGYTRIGGRKTYIIVNGENPINMTKDEFIAKIAKVGFSNVGEAIKAVKDLKTAYRSSTVVAKCSVCKENTVTAANIDYVQRNYESIGEKMGREVSPFDCICHSCQKGNKKETSVKEKVVGTCVSCNSETDQLSANGKCEDCWVDQLALGDSDLASASEPVTIPASVEEVAEFEEGLSEYASEQADMIVNEFLNMDQEVEETEYDTLPACFDEDEDAAITAAMPFEISIEELNAEMEELEGLE